ncbi:MAG TPA: hypothetical protein VEH31_00365, partial [Streptosporangiaceae bacterium]|nr:hypothetical protein [Streptosporangiaceae bacterium]
DGDIVVDMWGGFCDEARTVEVTDELRRATHTRPAFTRRRPVPLMTRHEDSVHRRGPAGVSAMSPDIDWPGRPGGHGAGPAP